MGADRILSLTGRGELRIYDGANANYISIRSALTLGAVRTLVLPGSLPSSGQALVSTDGAGTLGWANNLTASLQSAYNSSSIITVSGGTPVQLALSTGGELLKLNASISGVPYISIFAIAKQVRLGCDSAGNGFVGTQSLDGFEIWTNAISRITINSVGEIGIGVTPETNIRLKVSGEILLQNNRYLMGEKADASNSFLLARDSSDRLVLGDSAVNAETRIITGNSAITFLANGSERARIDSAGRIGIGQSSPSLALLEILQAGTERGAYIKKTGGTGANAALKVETTTAGVLGVDIITANAPGLSIASQGVGLQINISTLSNQAILIGHEVASEAIKVTCGAANNVGAIGLSAIQYRDSNAIYVQRIAGGTTVNAIIRIDNATVCDDIKSQSGAKLTSAGVWTDFCSVKAKEEFHGESDDLLLRRMRMLKLQFYRYKKDRSWHFGPTAEDFHEVYNLGDDQGIRGGDLGAMALALCQVMDRRLAQIEQASR